MKYAGNMSKYGRLNFCLIFNQISNECSESGLPIIFFSMKNI